MCRNAIGSYSCACRTGFALNVDGRTCDGTGQITSDYMITIIQIYSGITRGGMINGELHTQRLQKLIYLCLSTDCFMKISLH